MHTHVQDFIFYVANGISHHCTVVVGGVAKLWRRIYFLTYQ